MQVLIKCEEGWLWMKKYIKRTGEKSYKKIFIVIMNQANAFLEYIETNMDKFAVKK